MESRSSVKTTHRAMKAKRFQHRATRGQCNLHQTAARTQTLTLVNDEGEPLRIVPDLLVVSPQNKAVARTIFEATEIRQVTNIYKCTAELLVVPELAANPDQWFLLCTIAL